jgi:RNA polymerase sigma factor (sigma-70 family)
MTDWSNGRRVESDPLLTRLLSAAGEERERIIETLLLRAAETVSRVLQRQSAHVTKEDLDDIRSTVNVRLIRKFHELPAGDPIGGLAEYVAGVAYNAFHDFLRHRHPERVRIKGRIRYALSHDRRFTMWESPSGIAAGLAAWSERQPQRDLTPLQSLAAPLISDPQRTVNTLAMVFQQAGAPLLLDDLVSLFMSLWNIREAPRGTLRETAAPESSGPHSRYESRQFLSKLWGEIRELPPQQRTALLLNLRDSDGRNAMVQFVLAGIASAGEIAAALDLPAERLREIWNDLPMDDRHIAEMLGRTRQQVINLRKSARERLSRRMSLERRK